jgi:hypothetical protein
MPATIARARGASERASPPRPGAEDPWRRAALSDAHPAGKLSACRRSIMLKKRWAVHPLGTTAGRDAAAWLLFGLSRLRVRSSAASSTTTTGCLHPAGPAHLAGQPSRSAFFYHQTPLLPFARRGGDRAALASCIARNRWSRRHSQACSSTASPYDSSRVAGPWSPCCSSTVPLQFYGSGGTGRGDAALRHRRHRARVLLWRPLTVVCGVMLCCLSVLYKPLTVAACLAGYLARVVPEQRCKIRGLPRPWSWWWQLRGARSTS